MSARKFHLFWSLYQKRPAVGSVLFDGFAPHKPGPIWQPYADYWPNVWQGRGAPRLGKTPEIHIGLDRETEQWDEERPWDLEDSGGILVASPRAKDWLMHFDAEAFDWILCDVYRVRALTSFKNEFTPQPPLWAGDIIRVLDVLDEGRSDIKIDQIVGHKHYDITPRSTVIFHDDQVESHVHFFRLLHGPSNWFVSDEAVMGFREAGFSGMFVDGESVDG